MSIQVGDKLHYLQDELYRLVQDDISIFEFLQSGSLDGVWYWDLENLDVQVIDVQMKADLRS